MADLFRRIAADLAVIRKDWSAVTWIVAAAPLLAFVCLKASEIGDSDGRPGFYTEQLMIALDQFCFFPVVVFAAYLGAKDFDWGTAAGRVAATGRLRLGLARVLGVVLFAVLASVACLGVGLVLDLLVPDVPMPDPVSVLVQVAVSAFLLCFWGAIGLLFGFVLASFAAGLAIPMAVAVVEFLVPLRAWPEPALAVLPLRSIRSILHEFSPTPRGFVVSYLPTYNETWSSTGLLATVLAVCFAGYLGVVARREF